MGEMASLWGYEENIDIGQKLLYAVLELENLKAEAMAEMEKNRVFTNHLIQLIELAIQERDEAHNQLLNKTQTNSGFSPVNSLPGATVPLPELSTTNSVTPNNYVVDRGSLIIERLCEGRVLPQRGKFLEAVFQAGFPPPVVAAPLPEWRNPPQLQMPIEGCEASNVGQLSYPHYKW